jgi:hypothetical protein
MSIDEAWHGNHPAAIDFLNSPTSYIAANRNDLATVNQQVARFDDAERWIH